MPNAGDILTPTDQPQGLIAQYKRTTSTSATITTTETPYVRMDSIPVRAGYSYEVHWLRPIPSYATSATSSILRIRGNQSGAATIASTLLEGGENRCFVPPDTSNGDEKPCIGIWECTSSGTLSLIFTIVRASGTGSVTLFGSTGAWSKFMVKEIGLTQTSAGVDL